MSCRDLKFNWLLKIGAKSSIAMELQSRPKFRCDGMSVCFDAVALHAD